MTTPIEKCFVEIPNRPTLLKISPKEWKLASLELKKQLEELDFEMMRIVSVLWAEEFSKYPEKSKLHEKGKNDS